MDWAAACSRELGPRAAARQAGEQPQVEAEIRLKQAEDMTQRYVADPAAWAAQAAGGGGGGDAAAALACLWGLGDCGTVGRWDCGTGIWDWRASGLWDCGTA